MPRRFPDRTANRPRRRTRSRPIPQTPRVRVRPPSRWLRRAPSLVRSRARRARPRPARALNRRGTAARRNRAAPPRERSQRARSTNRPAETLTTDSEASPRSRAPRVAAGKTQHAAPFLAYTARPVPECGAVGPNAAIPEHGVLAFSALPWLRYFSRTPLTLARPRSHRHLVRRAGPETAPR